MSNPTARVLRASAALRAYVQVYGHEDECNVTDLITDLMHYQHNRGLCPLVDLNNATMHFEAEKDET
jgi:hypothetical protein